MKNILLSKTFWVQVIALLALVFPPVKQWFLTNPVDYLAALAAVNVLLRFVTSGRVYLMPENSGDETSGDGSAGGSDAGRRFPAWVLAAGMAGGFWVFSPPSCTAGSPQVPVKACYIDRSGNSVCYSTADGITATVDRRSGK